MQVLLNKSTFGVGFMCCVHPIMEAAVFASAQRCLAFLLQAPAHLVVTSPLGPSSSSSSRGSEEERLSLPALQHHAQRGTADTGPFGPDKISCRNRNGLVNKLHYVIGYTKLNNNDTHFLNPNRGYWLQIMKR